MSVQKTLFAMYNLMFDALGPSYWWPGETPFEVCLGAILTQNTNWSNVERAIWNLRQQDLLDPERIDQCTEAEIGELIRPSGYFRQKAKRLKTFVHFLREESGYNPSALASRDFETLRRDLLRIKGIGPETADSILLYALHRPSFVVDAYTARILQRHGLVPEDVGYDELRNLFMDHLPEDVYIYQEYHALLVRTGKRWCKKKSGLCADCPLLSLGE